MAVTLDISSKYVRIVSTRGNQVEKWITQSLPDGSVIDGLILLPEEVAKTIKAALKSAGIAAETVNITITGMAFTYRVVNLPHLKPALMSEAILRAAQKEMPMPLEEIYLAWQMTAETKDEVTVFLAGARRNLIDALVNTLKLAGLRPAAIDLKALAMARAANRAHALVVNFSPECFDIVLVAEGVPVILHTVTPRMENAELEDNIRRLSDELARTVDFYNITHAAHPFTTETPLLISGELAEKPEALPQLQAATEYKVEKLPSALPGPATFPASVYAGNIGLALKGKRPDKGATGFRDIEIDFRASKQRIDKPPTATKEKILPGILIGGLVLLALVLTLRNAAASEQKRLQQRNDILQTALAQARAAADAALSKEAEIKQIQADTANLQNQQVLILGKDANHAAMLGQLVDALPPEVSYTTIVFTLEEITIRGEAGKRQGVIDYANALQQNPAFTEVRIKSIEPTETGLSYEIVVGH
ncbi:MAG: pilus assembly protein PilM [Dehalococcoidales bacterium]|nr:pilus assembly protein PilM [Dehalococcoidales bacterium]